MATNAPSSKAAANLLVDERKRGQAAVAAGDAKRRTFYRQNVRLRNGSFILCSATKAEFSAPSEGRSDHRITGDALPDYQTVCGIFVCRDGVPGCGTPAASAAGLTTHWRVQCKYSNRAYFC